LNRKSHLQPFLQVAFSPSQSLMYSSKAALITALTVVPCSFALRDAFVHTLQAMRIDRIGVAIILVPFLLLEWLGKRNKQQNPLKPNYKYHNFPAYQVYAIQLLHAGL
jgi:hypothetical protein